MSIRNKLSPSKYFMETSLSKLRKRLNRYDVIYSKNELLEAFILKFFMGYKNIPPVIFGCHTPVYYPVTSSFHSKLHNLLYGGFVYKFLISGVTAFHVINHHDYVFLKKKFPDKDIIHIPNPFDFTAFKESARKNQYNDIDTSVCNILWVGRLTEQKGVNDLITIINEINALKGMPDKIRWTIVGKGLEQHKIHVLQDKWKNILYIEQIENAVLANIYSKSNIFLSTSKWEGLPYNLLEAQSVDLPAIAYDISGVNEIITHDKNGFLVTDIKQMQKQIRDMIEKKHTFTGFEAARKRYTEAKIYKQLIQMFENHQSERAIR